MLNFRSNKAILLILILCIPTTILIAIISTNVHATEYIPEENLDNKWYWHDDIQVDDILIYKTENSIKNLTSGKMMVMSKELMIYNITGFKNATSMFGYGDISYINGTWNYYNCTSDKIIPSSIFGPTPHNIAGFGFNNSGSFREYYEAELFTPNCIFLPINGSRGLEVDVIADIINNSYFYLLGLAGYIPQFDSYSTNTAPDKNNIYFEDTSSNYFLNATYYDNGTLRYYEGSYFIFQDVNTILEYNFTQKIVFSYNITDEVEWDVNVGDTFYYGSYGYEQKIVVSGFKNDIYEQKGIYGSTWQCYEAVLINKSVWNSTTEKYDPVGTPNSTNSLANNFYPWKSAGGSPLFMRKYTEIEDLEFMWNNYTHEVEDAAYFPFDEIYHKIENGYFVTKMKNSNNIYDKFELIYDKATGICSRYDYNVSGVGNVFYYRKNMTVITNQAEAENVLLHSDFIGNNTIYMNFTYIPNEDLELYWAALPVNPTLTKFPNEIYNMPLYLDVYANFSNYFGIHPVNLTLNYDDSLLNQDMEDNLAPYRFNSSLNEWERAPDSIFTLDTSKNTIMVEGLENVNFSIPQFFAIGTKEWTWGVDVDDLMPFEVDIEVFNHTISEFVEGYLDFWIYNITSIENLKKFWSVTGEPHQIFSQVNFTWMYYNISLGKLVRNPNLPFGEPSPLMEFCDNETSIFPLKFGDQNSACLKVPFILPLKYGELNLSFLAPILNETFFNVYSYLPKWDYFNADDDANTLLFSNSDGYYMDLTYYENGTLNTGNVFYTQGGTEIYNITFTRRDTYNVTSDVEWSVKAGDELYFGDMDKEIKYHIVKINETAVNLGDVLPSYFDSILTFSQVWADIYYWNSTDEYWMYQYRSIVGAANNLYPFGPGNYYGGLGIERVWPNLLMPIGINGDDTLDAMKSVWPYTKVDTISGIGANYLYLTNSTGPQYLYSEWNYSTGVIKLFHAFTFNPWTGKWEYVASFAKNNVSLQIGNYIIDLDNYFIPEFEFTVNITTNSTGCEFYYTMLDINPTNESLPIGTPLFYGDMMINNHTKLADNFTLEVRFPVSIDIDDINLYLSGWFDGSWQTMPIDAMNKILTYNSSGNSVLAELSRDYPIYSIGAWSYTLKPPGAFLLSTNATDPDVDGYFNLTWDASYLATSYSVYVHDSSINEGNLGSATLLGTYSTPTVHLIENYSDGIYFFIVRASNADEDTLSNCIQVNVTHPGPPGVFNLTSTADVPDIDGIFTLTWGAADGAVSYSVYRYSSYITVINSSLTTLATSITSLSHSLSGYNNGTYYFIVVAHNAQGDTLSNCHTVVVAIPPEEPEDGEGNGGGIPGYSIYLLLTFFTVITAIIILKNRKKVI